MPAARPILFSCFSPFELTLRQHLVLRGPLCWIPLPRVAGIVFRPIWRLQVGTARVVGTTLVTGDYTVEDIITELQAAWTRNDGAQ